MSPATGPGQKLGFATAGEPLSNRQSATPACTSHGNECLTRATTQRVLPGRTVSTTKSVTLRSEFWSCEPPVTAPRCPATYEHFIRESLRPNRRIGRDVLLVSVLSCTICRSRASLAEILALATRCPKRLGLAPASSRTSARTASVV